MRSNRNFTSDERELTFPRLTIFPEFRYCKSVLDVQLLSHVQLCDPMDCRMPGFSVLHYFLELAQTHDHESLMPSNHLIHCCPLLLLPSIFLRFRVFSNVLTFFFFTSGGQNIGASASAWVFPKNTQGCFPLELTSLNSLQSKSLLQPCSSKASVLRYSPSFMIQFSHPYMTTGKTIALTIWTFVNKVISLLCNTLSMFVIAFLPKNKHLLISWMQSLSVVILKPKKMKYDTVSITLFCFSWNDWTGCHGLCFLNVEF